VRLIGFQNGIFAAITDSGATATSSNGVNWAVHAANANAQAQFYAAGNGKFVGIRAGGMGPGSVVSSSDGVNWQVQTLSSGVTHTYVSLSFGGGAFIMTDNYGEVAYSADGVNWTGERQAPQAFSAAAFQNGIWMLLGGDSILISSGQISATALSATLQLTQASAGVWSLVVSGTAGATFSIETAASVNGPWGNATSVQIPVSGRATVPVTLNASSAFFRATSL
jgi:hypothetical protein